MKQLSRIILAGGMLAAGIAAAGCSGGNSDASSNGSNSDASSDKVKVGLICLHDDSSTYDKNFIDAMNEAVEDLKDIVDGNAIIKTDVPEKSECVTAAKDLIKQGCNVIFADSFGHEQFLMEAAEEYPNVTFCHATGTQAKVADDLPNFHNAFASIYEGRYLAGYQAGLELKSMVEAGKLTSKNYDGENIRLGYVGAFPYAEVVSGYTSWFLGVREVVPNVVMDVTYTSSWYDYDGEKAGATSLANRGAAIISQHADSMGAPGACEELGVPNVTYNNPLDEECPKTYLAYSKINWAPYYKAVINAVHDNKAIEGEVNNNWTGTLETGSVVYGGKYDSEVASIKAELIAGTRKVFDTSKFTVKNAKADTSAFSKASYITMDDNGHLTAYNADIDDYGDYIGETNAIKTEGGITYFDESGERSAPYFDIIIDGINPLN